MRLACAAMIAAAASACTTGPSADAFIANNCRQAYEECLRSAGGESACRQQQSACEDYGQATQAERREKQRGFDDFKKSREDGE